jgi:poly-gamma-glutamate capsule biosynthesis protein CapA/YwtB (metallophosphatase superfamily)
MKNQKSKITGESDSELIKLSFVGDIFLSGTYIDLNESQKLNIFKKVEGSLKKRDIVFGNFEGVVVEEEISEKNPSKKIKLPVHSLYVKAIKNAGFNVLSLSNNHVFDYGKNFFKKSHQILEAAGLCVFGAGETVPEAENLLIKHVNGIAIGFLGFTCPSTHPGADGKEGLVLLDAEDTIQKASQAKNHCDVLVVSLHWGDEHVSWPSPYQIKMAQKLIESGVDIIVGHHAHVFQGCERYRHGVIAYGLGGITIAELQQQVVWQGKEQAYKFTPQNKHRRTVVMNIDLKGKNIFSFKLKLVTIGTDGQPRFYANPLRQLSYKLNSLLWANKYYPILYKLIILFQFNFFP